MMYFYRNMPISLFPVMCIKLVKQPMKNRMNIINNVYFSRVIVHTSLLAAAKTGILT